MGRLSWTFQQVNVDAALTPNEIVQKLLPTLDRARRLTRLGTLLDSPKHREVQLCIFLDEVNTSSYMGVFKELIVDRRLNGVDLPDNVVVIAACNPARDKLGLSEAIVRREELGKEWAMGHYQVHPLPKSIEQLVWDYGALTDKQEEEFVEKRLALLYDGDRADFPYREQRELATLICKSQTLTRDYAYKHIAERVAMSQGVSPEALAATNSAGMAKIKADIKARASSVVSLRDIQRVFTLFNWFCELLQLRIGRRRGEADAASSGFAELIFTEEDEPANEQRRRAMLLTIGVVYYLRLSPQYRAQFHNELHRVSATEAASYLQLDPVLDECMTTLLDHTDLEVGIAKTQGLKENIFMTVVCTFARIPLTVRAEGRRTHTPHLLGERLSICSGLIAGDWPARLQQDALGHHRRRQRQGRAGEGALVLSHAEAAHTLPLPVQQAQHEQGDRIRLQARHRQAGERLCGTLVVGRAYYMCAPYRARARGVRAPCSAHTSESTCR